MSEAVVATGVTEPLEVLVTDVYGAALTGLTDVAVYVRRSSDGKLLDWNDNTFKSAAWTTRLRVLTETDATNEAGWYRYSWDTSTIVTPTANDVYTCTFVQTTLTNAGNLPASGVIRTGRFVDTVATNLNATVSSRAVAGDAMTLANDAITAAKIATGAIDADALATDAVNEIVDAVWDEVLTGATHDIPTSAGRRLREVASARVVLTGTASAGTSNTITLTGGSAIDHTYRFSSVVIIAGTGAGQTRTILDYVGSSKVAFIGPAWTTTPDATSEFVVTSLPSPAVVDTGMADGGSSNTIQLCEHSDTVNDSYVGMTVVVLSGTGANQSRLVTAYNGATFVATVDRAWGVTPDVTSAYVILGTATVDPATATGVAAVTTAVLAKLPASLVGGRIDASVGAMASDVLTSSALAASAVTEIQSGLAVPGSAMTLAADAITSATIAAGAIGVSEAPLLANLDVASSTLATAASLAAVATDATKSRRALWNRRALSSLGVFTLYADDAVTPLATATVTDKDGAAITLNTGDAARTTALT